MRVTHVITRLIVGGAQENTIASVIGLRRKPGLEIGLISGPTTGPEGELVSSFKRNDSEENPNAKSQNPELTIVPELIRPLHPIQDLLALRRLKIIFRETKPHIVHTHSGKAGILGRLAAAQVGVPVIVHTIHGPSFGKFQGTLPNALFRGAERHAGKVTTHFVTVADAMTEQYLAAGIGRREQFTKIFSGFDLQPYLSTNNDPLLRQRFGIGPDDLVVGKIARLFKLKGHDDLFAVAPHLIRNRPRLKFLLVGDGEWREKFERRALDLGVAKHFVFTGLVAPQEIPKLAGIMDVLVHLSLREGLARALPQALAAARPVIAYDCDGAKEVCLENKTGFLVKPGDLATLSDRILLLANDKVLRDRLGNEGRQFVQDRFSVEKMVDDLHRLYLQLAEKNSTMTT